MSLVVDFHYCGGELESISLYHADEDGCCGKEEGKRPGCCTDKLVAVDTDDNEAGKNYIVKNTDVVTAVAAYTPFESIIADYDFILEKMVIPINHAPPDDLHSPLFIKNRVLLI